MKAIRVTWSRHAIGGRRGSGKNPTTHSLILFFFFFPFLPPPFFFSFFFLFSSNLNMVRDLIAQWFNEGEHFSLFTFERIGERKGKGRKNEREKRSEERGREGWKDAGVKITPSLPPLIFFTGRQFLRPENVIYVNSVVHKNSMNGMNGSKKRWMDSEREDERKPGKKRKKSLFAR